MLGADRAKDVVFPHKPQHVGVRRVGVALAHAGTCPPDDNFVSVFGQGGVVKCVVPAVDKLGDVMLNGMGQEVRREGEVPPAHVFATDIKLLVGVPSVLTLLWVPTSAMN